jgi:hypothetical protein
VKIVKPAFHKDARAWRIAGPTRDVVEMVIRNTRYVARSIESKIRADSTKRLRLASAKR